MNKYSTYFLCGCVLVVVAFALGWYAFTTEFSGPIPAISCLAGAVVAFIASLILISKGTRGLKNVESAQPIQKVGTICQSIGVAVMLYAAVAFFVFNDLPPNTPASRLPSLYLLFAGMTATFAGTAIRGFQFR